MSRKMTLSGKVAPLEEGKGSLADEMEYLERVKKNKKAKKKTISEARVIAEQAREASELTHVADSSTLLGRRLVIEESLTKMRLVFMIERIKQQKALDKERRKIVNKKKWQYLLPRFTKQQRTARSLENVVEYVELRDKRLEVSSVLEKLDREDKTLQKAKTNQEKFRETMGRFVHIPLAYETQVDKLELLGDLMADIREYRELLEPGVERDRFDYLWGLGEEAEEGRRATLCLLRTSPATVVRTGVPSGRTSWTMRTPTGRGASRPSL